MSWMRMLRAARLSLRSHGLDDDCDDDNDDEDDDGSSSLLSGFSSEVFVAAVMIFDVDAS